MWKFHWHHTDDEGKELTTTQTSVPIGEPVPVPDVGPGNTLTAVTLEPQEAMDPTGSGEESSSPTVPEPAEDLPDEDFPVDILGFAP